MLSTAMPPYSKSLIAAIITIWCDRKVQITAKTILSQHKPLSSLSILTRLSIKFIHSRAKF